MIKGLKKKPKAAKKEPISVSIDRGLKDEIKRINPNISDFITKAIISCLDKCPSCGGKK